MDTRDMNFDELQTWPEKKRVALLRDYKEDQWLDRKSAKVTSLKLANTMVGFANAEGGTIVIGIHDGKIEGIKAAGRENEWRQAALDYTVPPVRHKFSYLDCTNSDGTADQIVIIEIEASERVHTNHRGETYLRVGDETRKLNPREAQELMYDKGESTYDGSIVKDATLGELNDDLVKKYLKNVGAVDEQKATVLKARGLAKQDGNIVRPTIAGLLVLGQNPQTLLPHAHVRILVYNGSSRETGSRANVTFDRRIEGDLGFQIEQSRKDLKRLLPRAIRLGEEGKFEELTLVPEYVWIEALVNAVTHRSYSIGGDHIRIELFNDRLEVKSPGRLPGLVRLENIRSTRFARNPRIARALSDIRYGRELGEGVNRMFEEMHIAGLPDPIYSQGPAFVRVVLLEDPLAGRILRHLPSGSERFVESLSREGRATTNEAALLLRVTRPTARKYLNELADKGLIEHIGTSVMDPRGYWKIKT